MLAGGSFGNNGFLVKDTDEDHDQYEYRSSEYVDQSDWPRLEVRYNTGGGNQPPTITVTAPPAGGATADDSYNITWTSNDPDGDACTVDLYYDSDSSPGGETQIVSNTADDGSYVWNTSGVAEGSYYIYAVIDDGQGGTGDDYSAGVVTISHGGESVTVDLYPVKDAMINECSGAQSYNYGQRDFVCTGHNSSFTCHMYRTLLEFDLSGIPAGATVEEVLLHVTVSRNERCSYDTELRVYRLEHDWLEGTGTSSNPTPGDGATWLTSDGVTAWLGGPGAAGAGDCEQTPVGTVTIPYLRAVDDEVIISLNAGAVQEMLAGGSFENNGFLIKDTDEDHDQYEYRSSEYVDQSEWPRLEVRYRSGSQVKPASAEFSRPLPTEFVLGQNYPNPFNPTTSIQYSVISDQSPPHVTLKIYNILGQEVKTLVNEVKDTGYYAVTWDGRDRRESEVPSGVYFCRLTVNGNQWSETKCMVLMK